MPIGNSKTIIRGLDGLSKHECLIDKNSRYETITYNLRNIINNRVVILLGDEESLGESGRWENSRVKIKAPEGTKITIIGGSRLELDVEDNPLKICGADEVITRHSKKSIYAKNCNNVTAHENNEVIARGNGRIYAKWNTRVTARNNDEVALFYNEDVEQVNSSIINPSSHGEIDGYNGEGMSQHSGI